MQPIPCDSRANEVLVIGGCHVTGWKIGNSPCFWSGAADYWSDGRRTTRHGYASLTKVGKLLENHDVDPQGTLLLLQLGNFEAQELAIVRPLINRIVSIFRPAKAIGSKGGPTRPDTGEATIFSKKDETKLRITGGILLGIETLIPSIFRKRRMDRVSDRINIMSNAVVLANPKQTILLSTFPTPSPVHNYYRKLTNKFMRAHAEDRGFTYIDIFDVFKAARARGDLAAGPLFADSMHLAPLGHALVSNAIIERLDTDHVADQYACKRIAA